MIPKSSLEKLQSFKIPGFIQALLAQMESTQYSELSFEERLSLLIDHEHSRRLDSRTNRLVKDARLPNSATLEEVDFSTKRGLSKPQFLELCQGNWLSSATNIIITGPTGTGKTFLASVLAHSVIRQGLSVRFQRTNLWLHDLQSHLERQRLPQSIANLKRVPLLIFDEWLLDKLAHQDSRLLLELIDSRYNQRSCLFISQFPVHDWHSQFHDPTIADAILDRIVHNSLRLSLQGESMRKLLALHQTPALQPQETATSLRSDNLDL